MTTVLLHEGSAAPKLEPPPRPQVRAVRGGNHGLNRVRHVMRTAVIVLILAVSGGLAISSLMSGATLMELNAQVDEVSAQLAEAQSEYDYLNTRMNDITSRAVLEAVALCIGQDSIRHGLFDTLFHHTVLVRLTGILVGRRQRLVHSVRRCAVVQQLGNVLCRCADLGLRRPAL